MCLLHLHVHRTFYSEMKEISDTLPFSIDFPTFPYCAVKLYFYRNPVLLLFDWIQLLLHKQSKKSLYDVCTVYHSVCDQ